RRRAGTRDHTARAAGLRGATAMSRPRLGRAAPLVLALELLRDLVDDLHTARADARVDRGELGGLGLETRKRSADLTGGDEPAFLDPLEQGLHTAVLGRVCRSIGRGVGRTRRARPRFGVPHPCYSAPSTLPFRAAVRPIIASAPERAASQSPISR